MLRTHTCGELRLEDAGKVVTISGWVQKARDHGHFNFIDIRDRYGITQVHVPASKADLYAVAQGVGREFVIQVSGMVVERESKNPNLPTGNIEIDPTEIVILNAAKTPPFKIEDDTDGQDKLRMEFRYLDLRRGPLQQNMLLRHKLGFETRKYMDSHHFLEIETPYLIKSTPEGARDFIVPSRLNQGQFYALPQSPQTFKQLLMISGFDRYFQIVRCFRDEDLRADRQPEFTQIDCEMAFVEQEDILQMFEGLVKHLFREVKGIDLAGDFPRMTYVDAMRRFGSDKPDIRFGMELKGLTDIAQHRDFGVFNSQAFIGAICAEGGATYTRKQLDKLIDWVKRPQVGAKGLVWVKCNVDGSFASSVKKFYTPEDFQAWMERLGGKPGDLILVMSGEEMVTREQLGVLRVELGNQLGLRKKDEWKPLWVVDFPLLEEKEGRWHAKHHPFTAPKPEHAHLLESDPGAVLANAYDLTMNGVELGGGSIRIHEQELQARMFRALGFTDEEAKAQFGFLMGAFEYGAPPHGGMAFGFDRIVAMMGGDESIRDYIAFPKNNMGRDTMIDSPAAVDAQALEDLAIEVHVKVVDESDEV
ncbi:MAG TPA: aspartate--tRNA ligase [Bacteroidetes bacterium]|nr:aspartate--tRNA ligase [Bacteroidota bacterium]